MIVLPARHYVKDDAGYHRARGRMKHRKWKGRATCQARNQRASYVILTLGKGKSSRKSMESANRVTLSFCINKFFVTKSFVTKIICIEYILKWPSQ